MKTCEIQKMGTEKQFRLTNRDLELLRWANSFGFLGIEQVMQKWAVKKSVAYRRLGVLVEAGYLSHHKTFHGTKGLYLVTQLGADVSGSSLKPLQNIVLQNIHHDLTVVDLSIALIEKYGCDFTTERELKEQDLPDVFHRKKHLCDGVLLLADKRIAIEVELTKKGKGRQERIIEDFRMNYTFQQVWYFCGTDEIKKQTESFKSDSPFLHVYDIHDLLPDYCR